MTNKRISIFPLVLILLALLSASCAPDPRKEADAYATRTKAEQDALDQAQARAQDSQLHEIQMQNEILLQGHREQTAQTWRNGLNLLLVWSFRAFTIGACVLLLALAYSSSRVSIGLAQATVQAAQLRAQLIYLDERTRTFPLMLHYAGHGRYMLANPNGESVMQLDTRNNADRQMVAVFGAVTTAGMIGREARLSEDPAAISIIQAPIIETE